MDIKERLAKISFFPVKSDYSALQDNERRALRHCVSAAEILTDVYLRQAGHDNYALYRDLHFRSDAEGKDLLRYFEIQGKPWDAYAHNEPFIPGVGEKPKFGSFYPKGFTKEEWNDWLAAHPGDRERFESNYTVIKRDGFGFRSVPYAEAYQDLLQEAARELKAAAKELPEGNLKTFLDLRAAAFETNDYFESDMCWIDTDGNPFEATIGPYETYFDELLGLKASFEAFVGLPDKDATAALAKFTPAVPDFDRMLAAEFDFKPKGAAIPLEVIADVYRGGEAAFGYGFVAYNLPNDRRIHELKGSKKVFSRTMMQAKFNGLIHAAAERTLTAEDLEYCTFDGRLLFVLAHELSHGLGPSMVKDGDREVPFETKLGDLHSCLEEAKADMLGARLLGYFLERGVIDARTVANCILSEIPGWFHMFRHGYTEAHAKGHLMQYNWLREADALRYDGEKKVCRVDIERTLKSMSELSTALLNLQSTGSYGQAQAFMERWTPIPPELPGIVERLRDLPITTTPVYDVSNL